MRWLGVTGTLGADHSDWISDKKLPAWIVGAKGHQRTNFSSDATTARAAATASWLIGGALRVGATMGIEEVKNRDDGRSISGVSLGALFDSSTSMYWTRDRLNSTFGQLDLAWKDRVALTGAFRHDRVRNQLLEPAKGAATHPSVGVAWQISSEPWFPRDGAITMLRVRSAYGESIQSRLQLGGFAGPWLLPPESNETEVGADIGGLGGRATLAITYYRGKSSDIVVDPGASGSEAGVEGSRHHPFRPQPRHLERLRWAGSGGELRGLRVIDLHRFILAAGGTLRHPAHRHRVVTGRTRTALGVLTRAGLTCVHHDRGPRSGR